MFTHTRTTRQAWFILLALLLPLLAACGGAASAPLRAPIPGESAAGGVVALATAAPAAAQSLEAAATAAPAAAAPANTLAPLPQAAADGIVARPTEPPAIASQQSSPLRAGEVDDNADFASYLEYLRGANGVRATQADVSERYLLTVTNADQQPVLDARVRLFDGSSQVFEGRTYAGGKTLFLPRALGLPVNNQQLRVLIDKGNSQAEGTLTRGGDSAPTFILRGAEPLPATPRLDVLFLLDATGSMGDEIGQIQQTIASIAERIDQTQPRPALRFGLVAYRDRGDEYVTQVHDFTGDIDTFRQALLQTGAGGGGDEPEAMNEALHAAIQRVSWADNAVRLAFLVADAPPHLDYEQDYNYVQEARAAVAQGVKVYTIAASNAGDEAEYIMRQIAQQTLAHFIFLTYQPGMNAGAPGDTTVHQVDPQSFTVERLDDLVVQVVRRELAQAQGAA